ncbi:MAG TPA: NAD(P)-dependent oxidoreductase [Gemmatimonadales bacterium]
MKAFVTGGTGFVGSHLVEALHIAGHEVACLVRNPDKAQRVFGDRRPTIIRGSLADRAALRAGVDGAAAVFHVAGLTAARNRAEFFSINEGATQTLLDVIRGRAPHDPTPRFVYVSSLAAAGPSNRGQPLLGSESANPVTHYGASKLAGELAVRAAALPWVIVRAPAVYGPRDVEFLKVFRLAKRGLSPLFGDGSQELSLVHVLDLVQALLAVATSERTRGETYYPCHPEVVSARGLATAIHRAVRTNPAARPLVLPIPGPAARAALWVTGTVARLAGRTTLLSADKANEFLAQAWTCSPASLERDTGWSAAYDLAAGLAMTATWYREHEWF